MYYHRSNEKCPSVTSAGISKAHQAPSFLSVLVCYSFPSSQQDNNHEIKANFSLLTMSWGNTELFRSKLCRLCCLNCLKLFQEQNIDLRQICIPTKKENLNKKLLAIWICRIFRIIRFYLTKRFLLSDFPGINWVHSKRILKQFTPECIYKGFYLALAFLTQESYQRQCHTEIHMILPLEMCIALSLENVYIQIFPLISSRTAKEWDCNVLIC